MNIADPVGDHAVMQPSEELPGGTVIPSAVNNTKGKVTTMEMVTTELDENETVKYDNGLYVALASGRMEGKSDESIIREAVKITKRVEDGALDYGAAIAHTRVNGQANSVSVAPSAPEKGTDQPKMAVAVDELFLPRIRVTYQSSLGTLRTRYHSAEVSGEFLVLIFDKRCTITDMYAPPPGTTILEVSVGEGDAQKTYYVQSLGISLDLDPATRNIYVIALPVLPMDHELVREHLGTDEEEEEELLPAAAALPAGRTTL